MRNTVMMMEISKQNHPTPPPRDLSPVPSIPSSPGPSSPMMCVAEAVCLAVTLYPRACRVKVKQHHPSHLISSHHLSSTSQSRAGREVRKLGTRLNPSNIQQPPTNIPRLFDSFIIRRHLFKIQSIQTPCYLSLQYIIFNLSMVKRIAPYIQVS